MFGLIRANSGMSGRRCAAALAIVCATLAATTPGFAQSSGMTEQQMIDQLLGKATRSMAKPAAPAAPDAPADATKLRDLLSKVGTRAFSAKERTEIAEATKERPSLDFEIYFGFNSAGLQKAAMETMSKIGQLLSNPAFADRGFLIAGHTDAKGKQDANRVVSQKRAESVKAYLVKTYKIDPNRLRVIGYGKEQLKDTNQPFAAINRRVQIINLPDGTLTASR